MHAILAGHDGKLHWQEVPNPTVGDDEVLLEIHATALNRADLLQRAGQYPPPQGWPEWFGLEAAGIVRAMGPKALAEGKWKIGDSACALLGGGGYAEYATVPVGMLMPIPKGLNMTEAAALPEVFGASYMFLFHEGVINAGDTLLVQAGASGLASVMIPMAKAFGARVLTTVLNADIAGSIEHLHADRIINTSCESLSDVFEEENARGHGVDIVIDCLGGETVGQCLPLMSHGGRWIMIAALASEATSVDLKRMYEKNTRLIGTTLRSRTSEAKAEILSAMVKTIWPMIESGRIRPTVYTVLPIQEAEEAQRIMAEGRHVGKIVLKVR